MRIGLGPMLSYDVWRTHEASFSLLGAVEIDLLNQTRIVQTGSGKSEEREFNARNAKLRIGGIYNFFEAVGDLDLATGVHSILSMPHTAKSNESAENSDWWKSDSYAKDFQVELNFFVGLQSKL